MPIFYGHIIPNDITVTGKLECSTWRRQGKQEHSVFNIAGERMAGESLRSP